MARKAHLAVIHNIPGRLRVRLPLGVQVPGLEKQLRAHPGVKTYRHSPRARSVLLEYEPTETTAETLLELMASIAGIDVDPLEAGPGGLPAPLSHTITRAVSSLNAEIAKRTSYHLDMRTLLALSLGAWAATQIVRGRARSLPWSTALWYAYELFRHHTLALRLQAGSMPTPLQAVTPRRQR
jgi:hypothetical protein